MFNPADEDYPDQDQLQPIQSSDSEDDFSERNKKSPPKEIKELVHVKLSHLHEIISDDEGDELTSPIGSPPAEISALGGRDKFLRLKKKLEEDQAKHFNSESNIQPIVVTDVETLLESFRSERDQSSRSMVSKIEANPKFLELYQQVKDRDHKIIDLETKLMEQSRQIVDLEDNLNQREQLLTSKNEAVSVVQKKFEAELLLKKEELEKSQRLLFDMERNLGKVQDQWKEDKNRFNNEIQKQNEKFNSLESTRYQLTTQLAELQEQLVILQTENSTLREEKESLFKENEKNQKMRDEGLEKFAIEQQEMVQEKEKLELAQDLLSREKEILLEDSQQLISEKEKLSSDLENLQREKSEWEEAREKFDQEKLTFYKEIELIGVEKENLLIEREKFDSEKEETEANISEKIKTIEELRSTVEKYQTNIKKLKLQFQTKLKALKEEKKANDNQERVAELESKISELENKVTELEEEKGNLLLRLVDFDEHQDLNQAKEKLASDTEALERERLNLDLDLEALKTEKEQLNGERRRLDDYETSLKSLQEELNGLRESLDAEALHLRKERLRLVEEKEAFATDREALKAQQESLARDWEEFQSAKQANIQLQIQQAAGSGSETDEPHPDQMYREKEKEKQALITAEREAELTKQIQELTEALEKSQLNVKKLKIQFQSKLKALREEKKEKERDSVAEKEKDEQQPAAENQLVQEKITALQNKLAELEEEKGNLLLRVVDFDELQATHDAMVTKVQSLEVQLTSTEEQLTQLSVQHQLLEANPPLPPPLQSDNVVIEQLVKAFSDSESKVSQQSTELVQLSNTQELREQQILQLTQEIAQLQHTIQQKNETIVGLEEQIEFNREDFSSAVQDFDRAINRKNEEHVEMVGAHETVVHQLNEEISRLTQLLEEHTVQVTALTLQLEDERRQKEEAVALSLVAMEEPAVVASEKVVETEAVQVTQSHIQGAAPSEISDPDTVDASAGSGWGDWGNDDDDNGNDTKVIASAPEVTEPFASLAVVDLGSTTPIPVVDPQYIEALEKEIAELKNTLSEQTSELSEFNELTQEKNTEIMRLTIQLAELNNSFDVTSKEAHKKSEECDTLRSELLKLSSNLDQVVKSLADSEKTIAEKTLEFFDISEQKTALALSVETANERIFELTTIVSELTERLEETSQSSDSKTGDIRTIVGEKEELEAKLNLVEKELEELKEFQRQQNQGNQQNEELRENQLQTLTAELEDLKSENAGFKTQLESLYNEISNYKKQLESKESELGLYKEQSHELQTSVVTLHQQISGMQSHISTLEPLQGEISLLKSHLLEKEEELEGAYTQLEELKSQNKNLHTSLESVQSQNSQHDSSLQSEIANLKAQLSEKDEELEFTNDQIMSLSVKSGQVDKLAKSLNDVQLLLASKEVEFENFCLEKQGEMMQLNQRISKLNEEFDNEHQKTVELSEEVYNLQQELQSKSSQDQNFVENIQKSIQDKNLEISQLQEEKDQEFQQLQSKFYEELERLNNELKAKQDELEFTREEMTKLTEALNHVEQVVLKDVQEKEESMKLQVQELTNCVNEKDDEIKKIMGDYDEYYNQVRSDLDSKTKAVELLQQTLFEKNEVTARMEESLRSLKEKHQAEIFNSIEKHNEEEESLFERIGALTQENGQLKSTVEHLQNQVGALSQDLQELHRRPEVPAERPAVQDFFTASSSSMNTQSSAFQDPQSFFDTLTPVPIQDDNNEAQAQLLTNSGATAELESLVEAQKKEIYDQEVQITELTITVDELKGQLSELTEVKMELNVLSHENTRLREEVQTITRELNVLKNERTRKLEEFLQMEAISGPRSSSGQGQGDRPSPSPVEEPVVRATAYVTTDKEIEAPESERGQGTTEGQGSSGDLLRQKDGQIATLSTELRELKVKSGRVLQKLRQTTNKYEELQKTYNALKTKSEFSLESAFESEFTDQMKKKDAIVEENKKLISEIQADRVRLQNQVDVFERANEKLTEGKENQDRMLESLTTQKRNLEQEIMGLKWKLEELESFNSNSAESAPEGHNLVGVPAPQNLGSSDTQEFSSVNFGEHSENATAQELNSLRIQNAALSQEIGTLQQEINYQRQVVANLQGQLEHAVYSMQNVQAHQQQQLQQQQLQQNAFVSASEEIDLQAFGPAKSEQQLLSPQQLEELQQQQQQQQSQAQLAHEEIIEREILERKIELLQNKIMELETNESRYYDDLQKTRSHAQMLDMEVLTYQEIIDDLNRRLNSTERDNLKSKILQEEVNRLILILDEKDSSKCDQVTSELLKLQEEKALLEYQLAAATQNSMLQQQQHPQLSVPGGSGVPLLTLTAEQLTELENRILMLEIDLRREANARRVVQEQLFFHQASKSQNHKLGALVGNSMLSSTQAAVSAAAAANASNYGGGSPSRRSPVQPPSPSYALFTPPGPGSNSPRYPSATSTPIQTPDLRSSPLPSQSQKLQL